MIEEDVVVIGADPRTGTGVALVTREKGEVDRERKREVEVDREKRKKGVDRVKEKVLWVNEKGKVEVDHVNEREEVDQETKKVDRVNKKEKVGVDHVNEREVEVDLVTRRGDDLGVGLMTGGQVIPEIGTEGEVIGVDLLIDLVIIDTDPILVVVPEAEKEVKKRMIHPRKRDQKE